MPQFVSVKMPLKALSFCLACLLTLAGCGVSGADEPATRVLAAAGESAPGLGEGYRFEGFAADYSMGAEGHVIFSATANIEHGGPRDRKEAVWFGRPDALEPIAETGQAIPGSGDDLLISGFERRPMIVTRSGIAGFVVRMSASAPQASPQALLIYRKGKLVKAVAAGDPVPTPAGDGTLLGIDQFAMTDAGVLIMGKFARRTTALWYWDYSELQLVIADHTEAAIGGNQCRVDSLASTSIDMNASGVAVFRASLGGTGCARGGILGWDAESDSLIPVAMSRTPIAQGEDRYFQGVTGDARINDEGNVALHSKIYLNSASSSAALEMTLLQSRPGSDSTVVLDREATFSNAPELKLTHAILGGGLSVLDDSELIHFAKSNRNRIILRSRMDGKATHTVIAQSGTAIAGQVAARIGDGQVNLGGEVVFTSFIDDGPTGGTYQQELWHTDHDGELSRIAYTGQAIGSREGETIDRIEAANQSHEPEIQSTQGGRSRRISDKGTVIFAGRLRKASQWHNALFVSSFD